MSSLWDDDDDGLFSLLVHYDKDRKVDLLNAEADAAIHARTRSDIGALSDYTQRLEGRVARLEVVCEALIKLLEARAGLRKDELEIMIARVDLADGVEDGRTGSPGQAPQCYCPSCKKPANPHREFCVFCFEILPREVRAAALQAAAPPPPRMVECASCGKEVAENRVNFTGNGMVCDPCLRL